MIVLSHVQIQPLIKTHKQGIATTTTSIDLNLTTIEVLLTPEGIIFPDDERLTWEDAREMVDSTNNCFTLQDGSIEKIQTFSEFTQRHYTLMPTTSAPTMLISGIPMHRIKDTNPHADTLSKVKMLAPVAGRVLDTATGLGYTAIEMSKTAEQVTTIELDPSAQEIARANPWSQALFNNPKIKQLIGDSFDQIESFEDNLFSRVLHDPPTFTLAGDLYSLEFYRQLFRVLKPKGRLFHYIGDLDSPSGARVSKGAFKRLQEAGFKRVERRNEAFGLLAYK
jgi:predicted methyltransferase